MLQWKGQEKFWARGKPLLTTEGERFCSAAALEVYPLQVIKAERGGKTYYERGGKSWFLLDLWTGYGAFAPQEDEQLVLADGSVLCTSPRTGGHIPY